MYSHSRLMRRANELSRRYNAGESVLALSKRFDAPPVNTFRAILTGRGWTKTRIKDTLNKNPSRLNKRDREQFELAESVDRGSSVDQSDTQSAAEVFEEIATMDFPYEGIPTVPPRKNMTHMVRRRDSPRSHPSRPISLPALPCSSDP